MAIDLRSDTLTLPTAEMRAAMVLAAVGDAAYGEDPIVSELEEYCAALFGKDAAVFTCSGTMSNQIAVQTLTQPGDEVILDFYHHINYFEGAQTAKMAGVVLNTCVSERGILTPDSISEAIKSKLRGDGYCKPKLLCLENSISFFGGRVFPAELLRRVSDHARSQGMAVYVDGARILNACVSSGVSPKDFAASADLCSLCFAKGLGAPFGSVLVGDRPAIEVARKFRKWLGGNLHQSGIMAAAALFALRHHLPHFEADHANAKLLTQLLGASSSSGLQIWPAETNIVMFNISSLSISAREFVSHAEQHGVRLVDWTNGWVRAVMHHPISREQVMTAADVIQSTYQHFREGREQARRSGWRKCDELNLHSSNPLREPMVLSR